MKKRYQTDREQAVRQFHRQAEESEQELQLHLPLKEVAAALQQGVGELMRQAGLELMQLIMEEEVRQLAGERCQRREQGQHYRWGGEKGILIVDGRKTPIIRPRLRSDEGREQPLGGYELFRRSEPLDAAVWDKLMLGLSTHNYGQAVREFAAAYGIEKSAVSDHFMRVSRRKPRELLERPRDELSLCASYIDGVEDHSQHLIVALGLAADGQKTVLGLRQGATENAVVAGELLGDLEQRGVTGIVFGNIHLADVREWYETRVTAAGLAHVEPLWGEPPLSLVREVVERGFRPIVVSVDLQQGAADLLGREIDDDFVKTVEIRKNMDPCGERGEYHTFVYAGPTFNDPISVERGDVREERNHSLLDLLPPAPNPSP